MTARILPGWGPQVNENERVDGIAGSLLAEIARCISPSPQGNPFSIATLSFPAIRHRKLHKSNGSGNTPGIPRLPVLLNFPLLHRLSVARLCPAPAQT